MALSIYLPKEMHSLNYPDLLESIRKLDHSYSHMLQREVQCIKLVLRLHNTGEHEIFSFVFRIHFKRKRKIPLRVTLLPILAALHSSCWSCIIQVEVEETVASYSYIYKKSVKLPISAGCNWVGPRTGLRYMEKWKFFTSSELKFRAVKSVASRYTDCSAAPLERCNDYIITWC
jgi:hypothetical protein